MGSTMVVYRGCRWVSSLFSRTICHLGPKCQHLRPQKTAHCPLSAGLEMSLGPMCLWVFFCSLVSLILRYEHASLHCPAYTMLFTLCLGVWRKFFQVSLTNLLHKGKQYCCPAVFLFVPSWRLPFSSVHFWWFNEGPVEITTCFKSFLYMCGI